MGRLPASKCKVCGVVWCSLFNLSCPVLQALSSSKSSSAALMSCSSRFWNWSRRCSAAMAPAATLGELQHCGKAQQLAQGSARPLLLFCLAYSLGTALLFLMSNLLTATACLALPCLALFAGLWIGCSRSATPA